MGAGNKLDPTRFEVSDISKTSVCPLAKVMRYELKKRGITDVKVLYSEEEPKSVGGSISFVPSVAGLLIAGEVVRDLLSAGVTVGTGDTEGR
jgi:tRNA A37 threonylcarbamoyladenosine dehydratase